eukprot:3818026-Pyramimonas_sp.AAC.1
MAGAGEFAPAGERDVAVAAVLRGEYPRAPAELLGCEQGGDHGARRAADSGVRLRALRGRPGGRAKGQHRGAGRETRRGENQDAP